MPGDSSSPIRHYLVEETTFIKFMYPSIILCKGGNEIIIYDVTENLYYYIKTHVPVVFHISTHYTYYGNDLRVFFDYGDYLAYGVLSLTIGTYAYMTINYYKKYLEKSTFPDSPLLAGFEAIQIKFMKKDEDGLTLQFEDSLYSIGTNTYSLILITDSDYAKGELIHISGEGFLLWKKNSKLITYKNKPVNFSDNSSGESLYESQDYLQNVKCEFNPDDYIYQIYI